MAGKEPDILLAAAQAWGFGKTPPTSGVSEYESAAQAWEKNPPALPDGDKQLTVPKAASKVFFASILTRPMGKDRRGNPRSSWADLQQQRVIDRINGFTRLQYERGVLSEAPVPLQLPTTTNIEAQVRHIYDRINKAIPTTITPSQLDTVINKETQQYTHLLWTGQQDGNFGPTDEERQIAADITMQAGNKPAAQLKGLLNSIVWGRAADIVAADHVGSLGKLQQLTAVGLNQLRRERPNVWFPVDWITSELLLTAEEQKLWENMTWTVTPTQLIVQQVNPRSVEDRLTIPLSAIGTTYMAWDGTPRAIDILKMAGTRLLQPVLAPLIEQGEIGGLALLGTSQRSKDVVTFPVRNGQRVAELLTLLGATNRTLEETASLQTKILRDPDPRHRQPIRPRVVMGLLPDPVILEQDVRRTPQGDIDWHQVETKLTEEQQRADTILKMTAARLLAEASLNPSLIDNQGNPTRIADKQMLASRRQKVSDIRTRIGNVRQLQERHSHRTTDKNVACPSCGAPGSSSDINCPYCGIGR